MTHLVVIAPDKFKGSLSATQAAAAITEGLAAAGQGMLTTLECPIADGGEGTLDAAVSAGYRRVEVATVGPTGEPVRSAYARKGGDAVVEMADACGLARLPRGIPQATSSTSRGLGIVVAHALDDGCRRIVIGVGGSASTDGGAGFLEALGAEMRDAGGRPVCGTGRALSGITTLDLDRLHPGLHEAELVLATDVNNPLCGPHGAASVYAPQKGAEPDEVALLDAGLNNWADVVAQHTGADQRAVRGAGAAGGVGFAAIAVLGTTVRPGIDVVLDLVGIDEHLRHAAAVVTGEGSLDGQSLHGKAPVGVCLRARRVSVPTFAIVGASHLTPEQAAQSPFVTIRALRDREPDVQRCIARAAELVARTAEDLVPMILGVSDFPGEGRLHVQASTGGCS